MKKRFKISAIVLVIAILLVGFAVTHFIAPYIIIQPYRANLDITPANYNASYEKLAIYTEDSLRLSGYLIKSDSIKLKGIIIMVHGVGGCKEHFIPLGAKLSKIGISSIVFDGRAHGESEGQYSTYGYYEKKDVKKVVDFIKSRYTDIPVGIWGNSLGGAIALQAMAYDSRLDFGIIESTFANMDEIVFDYKKRYLKGFGLKFVSDYALYRAGNIADFDPNEVRPVNAVKEITKPMFIAHGDADKLIAFKYGETLFQNLKSTNKIWYPVENAGHSNLGEKGGKAYQKALFDFIQKNTKQ
ncbi:lysophospholipase [bacterium]|nr:lysophospholipase [bacterium]